MCEYARMCVLIIPHGVEEVTGPTVHNRSLYSIGTGDTRDVYETWKANDQQRPQRRLEFIVVFFPPLHLDGSE